MRRIVVRASSFRAAGRQIGEETGSDLPFVRDDTVALLLENASAGGLVRLREIAETYLASTLSAFPQAIEYMEGLAVASGIPIPDIALIAFSEEIRTEFDEAPSKCSTLAVPTRDGWLIGHNEDYEPQYFGKMYALDMRIAGYPRTLSLNYPGHFPCLAGTLNRRRVAIANNSLWPAAAPGLSKNAMHFRAALADDMEEAVELLARQPSALTGHYTVASGDEDRLCGLEVSNPHTAEAYVHLEDAGREPYWHTNHVRFLKLLAPDPAVIEGNHTLVRGEKLTDMIARKRLPTTPEGLLEMLSTNDGVLHRTPEQNPSSVTLATVVMRPKTGEMWIRDADPSAATRDLHLSFGRASLN